MKCYFDEVKRRWRVELEFEATTWGETEEDARIEMNKVVNQLVNEVKNENREALSKPILNETNYKI